MPDRRDPRRARADVATAELARQHGLHLLLGPFYNLPPHLVSLERY